MIILNNLKWYAISNGKRKPLWVFLSLQSFQIKCIGFHQARSTDTASDDITPVATVPQQISFPSSATAVNSNLTALSGRAVFKHHHLNAAHAMHILNSLNQFSRVVTSLAGA